MRVGCCSCCGGGGGSDEDPGRELGGKDWHIENFGPDGVKQATEGEAQGTSYVTSGVSCLYFAVLFWKAAFQCFFGNQLMVTGSLRLAQNSRAGFRTQLLCWLVGSLLRWLGTNEWMSRQYA